MTLYSCCAYQRHAHDATKVGALVLSILNCGGSRAGRFPWLGPSQNAYPIIQQCETLTFVDATTFKMLEQDSHVMMVSRNQEAEWQLRLQEEQQQVQAAVGRAEDVEAQLAEQRQLVGDLELAAAASQLQREQLQEELQLRVSTVEDLQRKLQSLQESDTQRGGSANAANASVRQQQVTSALLACDPACGDVWATNTHDLSPTVTSATFSCYRAHQVEQSMAW